MFEDRVECGSWKFPFSEVTSATVFRTKQWFIPMTVLELVTENNSFQFGFNPWSDPIRHMNISMSEQNVRLKYSTFSLGTRVVLLLAVIWYFFN